MRSEQLTKCSEALQTLRAMLGTHLTGLSPPMDILYYLPFQCGTSDLDVCVCLFESHFLYCFHLQFV